MLGPKILVRSLGRPVVPDGHGNMWQYNSRSDRHSKIACWAILLDLLLRSKALSSQIASGEVAFGINHKMVDFKQNRKKDLDLVLCTPGTADGRREGKNPVTFAALVEKYGIELDATELRRLASLPELRVSPVGSVRMALKVKAAMTAHVRALPRLFDELDSSHLTLHGCLDSAIAVGFVMINIATTFSSSDLNKFPLARAPAVVSSHRQPEDAERVVARVKELPRRTKRGEVGYDAIAAIVVECRNDGSPVNLVKKPPAPKAGDIIHYASMIERVAELYDGHYG